MARLTRLVGSSSGTVVANALCAADSSTDNKTVIDNAISAAQGAGGGTVLVKAASGTGNINTSGGHTIPPGVHVRGLGTQTTRIKHTGNNVCFTYTEGVSPDGTKSGGGNDFTLLGNSGASAVGIKIADCYGSKWANVVVGSRGASDQYSAGIGLLMRTESYWTEGTVLSGIGLLFNKVGLRFERTASAGGQTAAQNSFAYTTLHDCWINVPDTGTGIDFGGPADNYILPYMGMLDVHIWLGVAGAPVSNAIGILVRANAEVPPNTTSFLRMEPKGSGTGNFTIQNLGGRFNPRNGLQRWNDTSASESRAAAGTTLMHGANPALALDPSVAVPSTVGFNDLWAGAHAGFGVTAKANQEASYTFGYSGAAGAPIHRFAGMGGAIDPTAAFDVDTNTKAWIDAAGAYCIGTLADFRKISRGSAAPESSVTGTRGDIYIRTLATGASLYVKAQGDATNTGWTCISALKNSTTWDPSSTVTGAASAVKTVTVTGASVGDFAQASFSIALPAGCFLVAEVTAVDTVSVYLMNVSGSTQDVASGTVSVRVSKN